MNALHPIRTSFQARVLLPVLAFLVLVPVVTLCVVQYRGTQKFQSETRQKLLTAEGIFNKTMKDRRWNLFLQYRDLSKDRGLGDLGARINQNEDRAGVLESAREYLKGLRDRLSADENPVEVVSLEGSELEIGEAPVRAIARRADSRIGPEAFYDAAKELNRRAQKQESSYGEIFVDGDWLEVVALPVFYKDQNAVVGVLTIAVRITHPVARDIAELAHSEVIFVANGEIAVSSMKDRDLKSSLRPLLANLNSTEAVSVVINNEHYKAISAKWDPNHSATAQLGYILLSSYEESLNELKNTQLTLWAVSFLALLASGIGVWLTIGRAAEPLRRLRDKAEAVGQGDFTRRLEVKREDELGVLARSFNDMTENLQTSRAELEKTVETLKSTQNQLIQREKLSAVGEFVAGVAHELNNPLTSLIGFAELLQTAGVNEKQEAYLNYIVKSSQRCHKIVQNLLSFARQHPPERNLVKISELIDSVVELLAYEMRTDNIEVLTRYDSTLPPIVGDFHQLQQVVLNILNNARHALEGRQVEGKIRVATERAGEFVRITIADNGPGISPENVTKIFDPFFTTKPVGKGTGLGLSLCYGIIKEHGGSIQASSQAGAGATFTIELPAAKENQFNSHKDDNDSDAAASAMPNGKRILVIDDEDWILTLTRKILEEDGFHVDTASNGETALSAVAKVRYDLLVCDQKMPGLSGAQLYRKLLVTQPDAAARLIFMTGDVVGDNFQQFLRETKKTCLTKPFSLKQLRSTVAEAIRSF